MDFKRHLERALREEKEGKFKYPEAGENAPEPVREAIKMFHKQVPAEQKQDQPLLYYILGDGTPPYKMSQEDSDYVDESDVEGQTCANCEYAYKKVAYDKHICSQIRGDIAPDGWCRLWEKANK